MADRPTVYVVCSDQHRNGKTLLARLVTDYLLLEGRDPFCIDLSHPEGALRSYFPGRTVLADFAHITGQMQTFDTMLQAPNRDYVIDVAVQHLQAFSEAVRSLDILSAASDAGLAVAILFVVDSVDDSLHAATIFERAFVPALFVPVRNEHVGSALPQGFRGPAIYLHSLEADLWDIVGNRRFSFRTYVLGDEGAVPVRLRPQLKSFLQAAMAGLADIAPALSLARLQS